MSDINADKASSESSGDDGVTKEKAQAATTVHDTNLDQVEQLAEKLGDNENGIAPLGDVEYVVNRLDELTVEECKKFLVRTLDEAQHDYNFGEKQREKLRGLLLGPQSGQSEDEWELQLKTETAIIKFYSPYPEVRAVTTPDDDPSIVCETIRAHLLGYFWAGVAQFVNSLFNSRFPTVTITSSVVQILLYPSGKLLALILPDWGCSVFGRRVSLNPGAWTYKEQMLSTIIVNVSVTSAYCFWNIQVQEVYYRDRWLTPEYKILLLLSTQMMGLGFAGLLRRLAVYPSFAIWPSILPTVALNRALLSDHQKRETIHGWTMSRYKFFFIVFFAMFVYFWLPGFLFPALSFFSWMTWIAPQNFNLAVVTGSQIGVGFNPISSFDWNVFGTTTGMVPLAVPFFSFVQQYLGMMLGGLVILGLYYRNARWTAYLPPNSSGLFDNKGQRYDITRVVSNGVLDEANFRAYSPAFQSAGKLVQYGAFFAFYPLTMVYVILDAWRPISHACRVQAWAGYLQFRRALSSFRDAVVSLSKGRFRECGSHLAEMMNDQTSVYDGFDDPLTNMMRSYAEVPDWWFLVVALIAFVFAIILITQFEQLGAPVWTIFFVIGLNLIFLIPMTYIWAMSGTTEGLNVMSELIMGYALPGHPEAMMFIKAYGYMINGQADNYLSDQKLGLYAKVAPRAMFRGQMISAVLTSLVAYGVVQFVDNDIGGICTPDQPSKFNCANGSQVVFAASVLFGAIGPKKLFDQLYPEMVWCFLLGFLLALVWFGGKRFGHGVQQLLQRVLPGRVFRVVNKVLLAPLARLKYVHPSLVVNGMTYWAPQNLTYFTGGLYVSAAFNWYLRRYKTAWWEKYNYILAAGLGGGVAFSAVIIFFAVQYHPVTVSWWGVNVVAAGVDGGNGQSALLTELPARGYFGPAVWT